MKLKSMKEKREKNSFEETASSTKFNPQNTGMSKIPTKLDITNSKLPKWDLAK